ncbi:MAG TPA: alpha/beta fold hydrolase [Planctomycetia bacterium]|nr:alpha/beta fold hydrolase [Planctomycetia bacterium]
MTVLFLHGWNSVPGGVKPSHLAAQGLVVINPKLSDEDWYAALVLAQAEFDRHRPDVVVGSSRGGAVAMNIDSGDARLVLLCPAWKRWGTATALKKNAIVLHSRADDVVPFADSEELLRISGLPREALLETGADHRLADPDSLATMFAACVAAVPGRCDKS